MSNFNRRIYQSQGILVGPTPSTGQHFTLGNSGTTLISGLSRIHSVAHSWELPREDVVEFGQLSAISREVVSTPNVRMNFSYYVTDMANEANLGFVVSGLAGSGALTNILNGNSRDKNYFIPTAIEGVDLVGSSGTALISDIRSLGNGFISSYAVEAAVGGFATATVAVEAFNAKYDLSPVGDTITGNFIPAVNPSGYLDKVWTYQLPVYTSGQAGQPIVYKQGDIQMNLSAVNSVGASITGLGIAQAHIQRFSIDIPFQLESLQELGSRFAYAKLPRFPLNVTLNISAIVNNLNSGDLSTIFCNDASFNVSIYCNSQSCSATPGTPQIAYFLNGLKIDSNSFNLGVGGAETVELRFTTTMGGPTSQLSNIWFSGLLNP